MGQDAPALPPHSIEAEMCLLSSLMLCDSDRGVWSAVLNTVSAESFFQSDHAEIFQVLSDLYRDGKKIDAAIVINELKRRGKLEDIGGVEYLKRLVNCVPSWHHGAQYACEVRENAILRTIISVCHQGLHEANDRHIGDLGESLAQTLARKLVDASNRGRALKVHCLEEVLQEVIEQRDSASNKRIPTGFRDLDRLIGGLRRGGKNLIGGKAGMGKSQMIKQLALNVSRCNVPVGMISIEESRHKIGENLLANATGIPNNRISFGQLTAIDRSQIADAHSRLAPLPIFVVDAVRTLSSIVAAAHTLVLRHKCQVVFIDHLHIIDGQSEENREREISKISAELKWTWKELGVAGVEAAQLNRSSGKERPNLASLRDSGSLEQDADVVILLHREDYYRTKDHDHVLELIIAKNKDGAPGRVPVVFDGARQSVKDNPEAQGDIFSDSEAA